MADFTGMSVKVTLKEPANTVVHGKVKEVIAGQTLSLQTVFFPGPNTRRDHWTIEGTAIADLQVVDAKHLRQSIPATQHTPQPQPSSFVDPAILTYSKSPVQMKAPNKPASDVPATPIKSTLAKAVDSLSTVGNAPPLLAGSTEPNVAQKPAVQSPQHGHIPLHSSGLGILNGVEDGAQELGEGGGQKEFKRRPKKKQSGPPISGPPPVMNAEVSRNGNDMNGKAKRAKGWRQTPLLHPSPPMTTPADKVGKERSRRQRVNEAEIQQNGWATEDATDIQDMGDFDFEA